MIYYITDAKNVKKDGLIKKFLRIYKFCNGDLNKFVLLLRKGGICQAIHGHAKVNNKYRKNYDKDITSSYLAYLDASNLYG